MNCRHSENDLALFVEGDLPSRTADEVEAHLPSCVTCREFVDELRETQFAFKSIRQETVSSAELACLRTAVLDQVAVRGGRSFWGRWAYALAGAAFMVAVMVGVLARYSHREPRVQQIVSTDPLPQAAPASVPLFKGDSSSTQPQNTLARSGKETVTEIEKSMGKGTVPLGKGDRRRRSLRQGVSPAENLNPDASPQQIMVKLQTDDPNIVIYWFVDKSEKNGGSL